MALLSVSGITHATVRVGNEDGSVVWIAWCGSVLCGRRAVMYYETVTSRHRIARHAIAGARVGVIGRAVMEWGAVGSSHDSSNCVT